MDPIACLADSSWSNFIKAYPLDCPVWRSLTMMTIIKKASITILAYVEHFKEPLTFSLCLNLGYLISQIIINT